MKSYFRSQDIKIFCPDISRHVGKRLDKRAKVNFILSNISRSKDNQKMKFGQLKDYNMRNIFLEKSYAKYGMKASPSTFYKKSKLSVSLDQQTKLS